MPQCAVAGCSSSHRKTRGGSVRYHRFPGEARTRAGWVRACGKYVQNCSTARVCSRHFADASYERDVQHELMGLPTRCRLRKGAAPELNLPMDFLKEEAPPDESPIDVLLAVGLVPRKMAGGLPQDLNKMQIMEDVREGCSVQPSSPGHAEEPIETEKSSTIPASINNGICEETTADDQSDPVSPIAVKEQIEEQIEEPIEEPMEDEEESVEKPSHQENGVQMETTDKPPLENNIDSNHTNEECLSTTSSDEPSTKRKSDLDESPAKRLRLDIQDSFIQRDKILNDFIEISECNSVEQMQLHTEQILAEIRTLNDLAREKEREWNNIIHLKKMKEELLLRMQRRKQVALLTNDVKTENGESYESQGDNLERTTKTSNQSILKANLANPNRNLRLMNSIDKGKQVRCLQTKTSYAPEMNGVDYRQNKQRPVLDVQSIIADYRQRHPERVPRRGRRIRNAQQDGKSTMLSFASLALGSGSQVQQNMQGIDANSELGILLNAIDSNSRPSSAESALQTNAEQSFKDMLVQLAFSQSERNELAQNVVKPPPPPYPEVTVHPVPTTTSVAPTNSLLHGILTKTPAKSNSKTSFSPTLARLLTAPERNNSHSPNGNPLLNNLTNPSNMSISEILSTSKARNEITITPVGAQFEPSTKAKSGLEEEEVEDGADRLVIDESNETLEGRGRGDNSSDAGDEVPQCQGCKEKSALFVCAGCGNQWYCSRDCQVSAWDEHSEVCSG